MLHSAVEVLQQQTSISCACDCAALHMQDCTSVQDCTRIAHAGIPGILDVHKTTHVPTSSPAPLKSFGPLQNEIRCVPDGKCSGV